MWEQMGSQNKEMYPEKVEMVVDPAQKTPSLGDDRNGQRRHRDVFFPSEYRESGGGESPLVVVDGVILPCTITTSHVHLRTLYTDTVDSDTVETSFPPESCPLSSLCRPPQCWPLRGLP